MGCECLYIPRDEIGEMVDEMDLRILELLMKDGRMSFRKIAENLGVSVNTVINRVNEMVKKGVVKGFIPEVDSRKLGFGITAIIGISATGPSLVEIERKISENENVLGVYDVTGNFDIILIGKFRDTEDLDRFIKSLQKIERIQRTETFVVLNTVKESGRLPVQKLLS
ncbi:MAG: hypothetical protein PWR13_930 [Archaeoglobi archaeon]|nr:hypothetical protein [Archaeoglobi archaeon]MDK2781902.1 hypothetical protein [Archaeoglobi archaeon]